MCTGNSAAGSSHGHTSNASVSVATAATWVSCSQPIEPTPRPGAESAHTSCVSPHAQPVHVAGADEHDVARFDVHVGAASSTVEVLGTDRVAGIEGVDAVQPRDVEQDAACHDRPEVFDAELRRAMLVDRGVGDAVVEHAFVADVGERVPVGRGLHTHLERVVAGGEVAGVTGKGNGAGQHAAASG